MTTPAKETTYSDMFRAMEGGTWGEETTPVDELVESARTEADLCRNETADDIANLLDRLADEITRLTHELALTEQHLADAMAVINKQGHELEAATQLNIDVLKVTADAVEIADGAAKYDLVCYHGKYTDGWYDTSERCLGEEYMDTLLRYLTARNLIERKPGDDNLVRFK